MNQYAEPTKTNLYFKIQSMQGLNQIRRNIASWSAFYGDLDRLSQFSVWIEPGSTETLGDTQCCLISTSGPVEILHDGIQQEVTVRSVMVADYSIENLTITNNSTEAVQVQCILAT